MQVHLWCYAAVRAPPGVLQRAAAELLPLEQAREWSSAGVSVQHLADICRLTACRLHPADGDGARARPAKLNKSMSGNCVVIGLGFVSMLVRD